MHNIFNDHIIDTENLEALSIVKPEPSEEDLNIRYMENILSTSGNTRYSFESGVDINNLDSRQTLQFSPRVQNSFREDIITTMKNNHRLLSYFFL